jgi:hypothetical protein
VGKSDEERRKAEAAKEAEDARKRALKEIEKETKNNPKPE